MTFGVDVGKVIFRCNCLIAAMYPHLLRVVTASLVLLKICRSADGGTLSNHTIMRKSGSSTIQDIQLLAGGAIPFSQSTLGGIVFPSPFNSQRKIVRMQSIYSASELSAAGSSPFFVVFPHVHRLCMVEESDYFHTAIVRSRRDL